MGKRIAVIMSYINREWQLRRTLESMARSEVRDFHVIIANDGEEPLLLPEYENVHVIDVKNKTWINQLPGYNMAIKYAMDNLEPDIIMMQNPECYHVGDVLKYTSENVTDNNYLAFSAYSLDRDKTFDTSADIHEVIRNNNYKVKTDAGTGWYNHPVHRPVYYEFCAAIATDNMRMLNGYDERMAYGIAYDDDYMVWRVRYLGLELSIVPDPFVVHQWHEQANNHQDKGMLVQKNYALYNALKSEGQFRAQHLITPDL